MENEELLEQLIAARLASALSDPQAEEERNPAFEEAMRAIDRSIKMFEQDSQWCEADDRMKREKEKLELDQQKLELETRKLALEENKLQFEKEKADREEQRAFKETKMHLIELGGTWLLKGFELVALYLIVPGRNNSWKMKFADLCMKWETDGHAPSYTATKSIKDFFRFKD